MQALPCLICRKSPSGAPSSASRMVLFTPPWATAAIDSPSCRLTRALNARYVTSTYDFLRTPAEIIQAQLARVGSQCSFGLSPIGFVGMM